MKHIAKHTLLFGAFAMLLSTMPMQAMESASPEVQQEVATKQGFFRQLNKKARNSRLNYLMKQLKIEWKPFIKCVEKGEKDCLKQAQTISAIIKSILALVLVGTAIGIGVTAKRRLGRRAPASQYTSNDQRLITAVNRYVNPRTTAQAFNELNRILVPRTFEIFKIEGGAESPALQAMVAGFTSAGLRQALNTLKTKGYDTDLPFYKNIQTLLNESEKAVIGELD